MNIDDDQLEENIDELVEKFGKWYKIKKHCFNNCELLFEYSDYERSEYSYIWMQPLRVVVNNNKITELYIYNHFKGELLPEHIIKFENEEPISVETCYHLFRPMMGTREDAEKLMEDLHENFHETNYSEIKTIKRG